MARPKKEINLKTLKVFCRLKPSLKDCADFYDVSEDTITRRINEETGKTFTEFRDTGMSYTKFALIRKAIMMARKGNETMLIFSLKNIADWKNNDMDGASIVFPSSIGFTKKE